MNGVQSFARGLGVAVLVTLGAVAAGCSGGRDEQAVTYEGAVGPGPYAVASMTVELVDETRAVRENGAFPGADERTLVTEVWYPAQDDGASAAVAEGGPFPLIVFAHGLTGSRVQSTTYTEHLASHGYIVAAPDFPLTNGNAPGGTRLIDLLEQPGDVSFVIDRMLAFDGEEGHPLEGAVDEESIGLTGHSFGAMTTLLAVYGERRDDRIDAAVALSASDCYFDEAMVGGEATPMMLIGGSADLVLPAAGARNVYEAIPAPRYYVELEGGNHVRFSEADLDDGIVAGAISSRGAGEGETFASDAVALARELGTDVGGCVGGDVEADEAMTWERQQELLRAFATPFFDTFLRGSDEAREFLESALVAMDLEVTYEFDVK
jgi:dienelactone hydrolase